MACCKVCCGCKECDEGEEGKCCCGSECCAPDTYCCNAECVTACSEGQEGDCKCTDACCYQDEYCCDGECVEACGEGGAGPCKCNSDCCAEGEYCCDGVCQAEPCEECEPCECETPAEYGGENVCFVPCVDVDVPNYLQCGCGEFNGVGADMGVQWAEGYVAANEGCAILLQVYANEDAFWRVWKCSGDQWINVSDDALVNDPEVTGVQNLGGYWCQERNGTCEEEPVWGDPPCDPPP